MSVIPPSARTWLAIAFTGSNSAGEALRAASGPEVPKRFPNLVYERSAIAAFRASAQQLESILWRAGSGGDHFFGSKSHWQPRLYIAVHEVLPIHLISKILRAGPVLRREMRDGREILPGFLSGLFQPAKLRQARG